MGSSWKLGSLFGVPIRIHWTAIVGALFFSGFRIAPGAWLGFLVVILVHELGHALVVKATKQRVLGVEVHGYGGHCEWSGNPTPLGRASIAWGGVWAQMGLFVLALPLAVMFSGGGSSHLDDLLRALTVNNLFLAGINLIPVPPLDGAEAWKLFPLLRARWNASRRSAPRRPVIEVKGPVGAAKANAPTAHAPKANAPAPAGDLSPELRALFAKVASEARDARHKRN